MRALKPAGPDVVVHGGGTVFIVTPITQAARDWVADSVNVPDYMRFGQGFAVEHRYVQDIIEGMQNDGLLVG